MVTLNGWVHRKRDHGGVSFINLRDCYGVTQCVVDADANDAVKTVATELHNEYCIAIEGSVRSRPGDMVNPDMPTGEIEVAVQNIVVLNRCEVLPFQIDKETNANEDLRLRYRYLDLRSETMQNHLRLRSDVTFAVREWMSKAGFLEIETPTFIKSTPEGARDYLVPSRLYPGKFYALPQSPQIYKQLLMVSGFDKYFQIARCYRDEDARGDRQPEFTQIDIEMSYASRDDVLEMTENLMGHVFKQCIGLDLPAHFTRLTYEDAMERFGSDKPDLRYKELELQDFSPWVKDCGFKAFEGPLAEGGAVKAMVVPGGAVYSRKQIEELEAHAKIYKAKGLAWMKVIDLAVSVDGVETDAHQELEIEGGVSKFFSVRGTEICRALGADAGDLILICADAKRKVANTALGAVRSKLGRELGLASRPGAERFAFAWIVDFPLFAYNEDESHWEAEHHMFSYPQEQFHATLESDPASVKGDLYDLVLNGYELASGSIRIHDPALQQRIFNICGITPEEAEAKFGFLTNALKYGAPPHGGIAPGLDRLVMIMSGETSIKEVIAFPKNSFAVSPMDDCPGEVSPKQLEELHLQVAREDNNAK
jgi:aspartyl-tRNA synthetase